MDESKESFHAIVMKIVAEMTGNIFSKLLGESTDYLCFTFVPGEDKEHIFVMITNLENEKVKDKLEKILEVVSIKEEMKDTIGSA
jgi:hypothetical protein